MSDLTLFSCFSLLSAVKILESHHPLLSNLLKFQFASIETNFHPASLLNLILKHYYLTHKPERKCTTPRLWMMIRRYKFKNKIIILFYYIQNALSFKHDFNVYFNKCTNAKLCDAEYKKTTNKINISKKNP